MSVAELDALIDRLLPRVLADRDLGDGRVFTRLHLQHLWALSCLHAGQCYDETLLIDRLSKRLPRHVALSQDISAALATA